MGLSPKYRGGPPRVRQTGTPAGDGARLTRPVPDRTEPVRAATGIFRQEAPPAAAPPPRDPPGRSAAEESVALAYQVFDRYLEEGRRFAEGQSAWYNDEAAQPDLARDAARSFADLLGLLGRFAQQHGLSLSSASLAARPTASGVGLPDGASAGDPQATGTSSLPLQSGEGGPVRASRRAVEDEWERIAATVTPQDPADVPRWPAAPAGRKA